MKIIFLDVDGILNCSFTKEKIDGYLFVMDSKIELLKEIVERTGAKIVLSSTWRYGWLYLEAETDNTPFRKREARMFIALRDKLREHGLELLDRTPVSDNGNRGEEIDRWLEDWEGERITGICILDDLNGRELRPHANRLVRTSFTKGLLPKHVELAVKLLNKPMEGA